MKGVVFTEFLELVEDKFGMQVADTVITKGCPFHMGFTAVGTYDHQELISMVDELSKRVSQPTPELVHAFGKHLFGRFLNSYPESFRGINNTFDLLYNVEHTIHVEVLKLNPDAELPHFEFPQADEGCFKIEYISSRPFADLAAGLVEACIEHFGEDLSVERTDLGEIPGTHAIFTLAPRK